MKTYRKVCKIVLSKQGNDITTHSRSTQHYHLNFLVNILTLSIHLPGTSGSLVLHFLLSLHLNLLLDFSVNRQHMI